MEDAIRPAEQADIPDIRSVARAAWHEAHAPIIGTETVEAFLADFYNAESFRTRIRDERTVIAVATDQKNDVIGYVMASPADDDETTFDLTQIYVAPARWGEGIGRRLLDHLEDNVRQQGGEGITLGVMAANDRAVGFYEAAGYERVDEVFDERIETTSYIYEKRLE